LSNRPTTHGPGAGGQRPQVGIPRRGPVLGDAGTETGAIWAVLMLLAPDG